jgi:hypothetical protein
MYEHSSYCRSGDNTLASAVMAVDEVASQPADDHMVFLLSDAMLAQCANALPLAACMRIRGRAECTWNTCQQTVGPWVHRVGAERAPGQVPRHAGELD